MTRKTATTQSPTPVAPTLRVRRPPGRVMHDITRFDSVGARAATYYRELELLATIVEDNLDVLRDNPDAHGITFVIERLDEALDRVHAVSQVKAPK
jgi:hypothetical protein